ncbi:MAG TPA: helix-turn-helix domain-containing protein [Polyangiaceae bacterium]|nr:helix-turn-helix domain-containing protein [Polyangiaceae bacterium]
MFHELMTEKREEILAACRAEVTQPEGRDRLAQYVTNFFEEIVQLLHPQALESLPPPSSTAPPQDDRIVGASTAMSRVRIGLNRLSHRSQAAVLILGEAGSGRRHCARALHLETYPDGEFFELDDPTQIYELERRLMTPRQRAATPSSVGLTVYVRELPESPARIQEKVGQLLREKSLPLRLIVSSREPLSSQVVRQGRLRSELLLAFPNELRLPRLAERESDVCELARHFAQVASRKTGTAPLAFSAAALSRLQSHSWPENVVELCALVDRLAREDRAGQVEATDLSELDARASGINFHLPPTGLDLAELERDLLTQALAMSAHNQTRAASLLGLTRDQMRYRLAKFEILTATTKAG